MILRKVIINGKAVYEPISYDEALAYPNKEALVFSSDDEKDDFLDKIEEFEELADRIDELDELVDEIMDCLDDLDENNRLSFQTRLEEIKKELEGYINLSVEDLEDKLDAIEDEVEELLEELDDDEDEHIKVNVNGKKNNFSKDFGEMFGKAFGNMFNGIGNIFIGKKNSKKDSLISALPFMDKEDLHELVIRILNEEEGYKELDLVSVMPFLQTSDCDALFMKVLNEEKNDNCPLVSMAPFVSSMCLSYLVDEYINGNYQDIEMSTLYPFLSSNDVKRVFNYILLKKE